MGNRKGYTTGSCCAAGTGAALTYILGGIKAESWQMSGPTGIDISVPVFNVEKISEYKARVTVIKDGGDDPDITTGSAVIVNAELSGFNEIDRIEKIKGETGYRLNERVYLKTGRGIGIVTKPGLSCPVGKGAVNPVPRQMILKEAEKLMEKYSYEGAVILDVSIPDGEALAEKTFNPMLGIKGGISVLGTTGQVDPMSSKAVLDTIKVQLSVAGKSGKSETCVITPGNYGIDFLEKAESNREYKGKGFELLKSLPKENIIKVGNFIGDGVLMAADVGFRHIIISGHLGKMIKVAGGMLDTHSKYGDNRIETAVRIINEIYHEDDREELCDSIREAVVVDEILNLVISKGGNELLKKFSDRAGKMAEKTLWNNLEKEGIDCGKIDKSMMIFTNRYGLIYRSGIFKQENL